MELHSNIKHWEKKDTSKNPSKALGESMPQNSQSFEKLIRLNLPVVKMKKNDKKRDSKGVRFRVFDTIIGVTCSV